MNLKEDIRTGAIHFMCLVDTDTDVIRTNRDAMMFNVWRSVATITDDYFTLKTQSCVDGVPSGVWGECEGYYQAFVYYDGKILKSAHSVYECM